MRARTPPPERHCLMLGRGSDASIKGFDIGAAAVSRTKLPSEMGEPIAVIRGAQSSDRAAVKLIESAMLPGARTSRFILRPFSADENAVAHDIRSAAVVLMPSREEGFGLVGLEAIAAGIPILVSSRSGLAAYLRQINAHVETVVQVVDEMEKDVDVWTQALTHVLTNLDDAFEKAENLRLLLEEQLSWTASGSELLAALEIQNQTRGAPPVSASGYMQAAFYLSRPLDVAAINRSAEMIRKLSENGPGKQLWNNAEGVSDRVAGSLIEQSVNAYRSDADAASQLEAALSVLRLKYGQMGFVPAKYRVEIREWKCAASKQLHDSATLERLRRYLDVAGMVAQDIADIPRDVLAYGKRHGLSMHSAVDGGEAIIFAGFGCPGVDRPISHYALENLERIFEAGANLVALDPCSLSQGYLATGRAASTDVTHVTSAVALARKESLNRSAISIMVQKKNGEVFIEGGKFVARATVADSMCFVGGKLGASSQEFLYRWGGVGPTPELEWRVSPGKRIARWCAVSESGSWQVFIESSDGSGYAYHERNLVNTWVVPSSKLAWPDSAAMWSDQAGKLLRAYLVEPDVLMLFRGPDGCQACSSIDIIKSVATPFFDIIRPENYIMGLRNPYRVQPGHFGGRMCLAIFCILDPGANVVFFLDACDFKVLRPPLICRHYFEEVRLVDAGGRSFFMATLMSHSGYAFAVWDVTDGSGGEEDPLSICCLSKSGGVLDCSQEEGGFSAWFTARALPLGSSPPELWRWRWPHNVCERILVLSEPYVFALAASSPLPKRP
ncbi:glycosyltransferase [Nannocystis sp. ILAH1]|uniref:glycosyltransferase n=1 Tax=Nannocystis sp. ILAH1 TaxID=2996789 RepID=UPI00320AE808